MKPLTAQQHTSAHAQFRAPEGVAPVTGIPAAPGEIVGHVTAMMIFTCCRAEDQGRPFKTRSYQLPLHMPFVGSEYLLQALPPEMDRFTNDVLKKVRQWEWRAQKDAERQAQVHRRPGT